LRQRAGRDQRQGQQCRAAIPGDRLHEQILSGGQVNVRRHIALVDATPAGCVR
jgi:hypothetical protein